jgi:hypothetical protein
MTSDDEVVLSSGIDRAEKGDVVARLQGIDDPVMVISASGPEHPGESAAGLFSGGEELARLF